jgi:hypothetical protein
MKVGGTGDRIKGGGEEGGRVSGKRKGEREIMRDRGRGRYLG